MFQTQSASVSSNTKRKMMCGSKSPTHPRLFFLLSSPVCFFCLGFGILCLFYLGYQIPLFFPLEFCTLGKKGPKCQKNKPVQRIILPHRNEHTTLTRWGGRRRPKTDARLETKNAAASFFFFFFDALVNAFFTLRFFVELKEERRKSSSSS